MADITFLHMCDVVLYVYIMAGHGWCFLNKPGLKSKMLKLLFYLKNETLGPAMISFNTRVEPPDWLFKEAL